MMAADIIRGPVGKVLGLIVWLVVFPLLIGAINGWYTQSVAAGVVSGERFDRVIQQGSHKNAEEAWRSVTGVVDFGGTAVAAVVTSAYKLGDSSGACSITVTAPTDATVWYTPMGSEVKTAATSASISGCKFVEAGSVFNAGGLGGLVEIILQAAALAPPLALLFALGSFGQSFLKNMGSHPILAAVMTVIMMLLVATLLNTFVPFLTAAFEAIDKQRFVVFDEGLGNVSTVVGNFYGVVLVASMMMIAWQVVKHLKGGGDVIEGAQRM